MGSTCNNSARAADQLRLLDQNMESIMARIHCRTSFRPYGFSVCALVLLSFATSLVSGCGSFFSCEGKASCPVTPAPGTPGSSSIDFAYVSNSATGTTYVNGYDLTAGTLVSATNAPFSFGYSLSAMAINPANTYMYVASDSTLSAGVGYIYGYGIGTGGALSILSSGSPLENESVTSIDISPDGQWLFALDTNGLTLEEYSINNATGALTFASTYGITGAANGLITPSVVKVAPTADYLVIALGTGGAETFSFNTSTGVAAATTLISPSTAASGIYAAAADSNHFLYCAGTAGLQVFSTSTTGVPTPMKTYTTGNGAHSLVINSASTNVYVGNQTDSTISGYAIGTTGALTPLTGSPYAAPKTVNALAIDSTKAYLIASGYNASTGIQLFAIGSAGALTSSASAGSGTTTAIPGAIAVTH